MQERPTSDAPPSPRRTRRDFGDLFADRAHETLREIAILVAVFGTLESFNGEGRGPSGMRVAVISLIFLACYGGALWLEWRNSAS